MNYSREVIAAVRRVLDTFEAGCDRCDATDLDLLENVGLMYRGIVEFPSDTLEIGETAWFFNIEFDELVLAINHTHGRGGAND